MLAIMANNAMAMMFMLLLIGGGVVAFVKRCEWFKMCDGVKFKEGAIPRFVNEPASKKSGKLTFTPEHRDDLSVKMVGSDGSVGPELSDRLYAGTVSKFARISYF